MPALLTRTSIRPVCAEHGRHEGGDRLVVGHIAGQHGHLGRPIAGRPPAGPEDREPRPRQGLGDDTADAGGGSGHDRGLSRICAHRCSKLARAGLHRLIVL